MWKCSTMLNLNIFFLAPLSNRLENPLLWVQSTAKKGSLGCNLLKLDNPASFEHEIDFKVSPALEKGASPPAKEGAVKYNARVTSLCAIRPAA